ncbi:MAG: histidine phosphatase family protein [Proteobacteria bacterium]|nr:histidine phosphatase family protein [Pseudomonadota bacterium]
MREPTRVFALRHGETAWNRELRIQGHADIPLSELGRWQAGRLAEALAGEGIAAIYTSDLERAHATARALAARTGAPLAAERALRERAFGRFEGVTFADIDARWPDEARRWRRREPDFGPGGGETLAAFYARTVAAASALAARHPGQVIALVAHGGVLDCLYRAAAGVDLQAPRSWQLGNAAINRLLWHGEGFVLVGWDDGAHLADPPPTSAVR